MFDAEITKFGHLYKLEYTENGKKVVEYDCIIFNLLDKIKDKVNSLIINYEKI